MSSSCGPIKPRKLVQVRRRPLNQNTLGFKPWLIDSCLSKSSILIEIPSGGCAGDCRVLAHNIITNFHLSAISRDQPQAVRQRGPHIRQREGRISHHIDSQVGCGGCFIRFNLGAGCLPFPIAGHALPRDQRLLGTIRRGYLDGGCIARQQRLEGITLLLIGAQGCGQSAGELRNGIRKGRDDLIGFACGSDTAIGLNQIQLGI
ncbi:hypothetical protein D3C73_1120730 [compost metagenome]